MIRLIQSFTMPGYIQLNREYQIGRGAGIEIYRGPNHRYLHDQSGAGVGDILSIAYQYLKPYFSSGFNALKNQGVESTGSILNQLGDKNIKTILKEEGKKALKNLGQKAIDKINRSSNTQGGAGMRNGLTALQRAALHSLNRKGIKARKIGKRSQSGKIRRVGSIGAKRKQIGGKRKRRSKVSKKRKTQIGGKRKRSTKKKPVKKRKRVLKNRQLDIFD